MLVSIPLQNDPEHEQSVVDAKSIILLTVLEREKDYPKLRMKLGSFNPLVVFKTESNEFVAEIVLKIGFLLKA